jgi:tetratricopeptide (TPR) repeat protein
MSFPQSDHSSVDPAAWREIQKLLRADCWSEAVALLRRLAPETGSRAVRLMLGAVLAEREFYHEAIQLWTLVIENAMRDGDRHHLAAACSNLAAVYRAVGDHDLARRFQQRALRLQDDCGAEDLLHLANDALAYRCWKLAESLLATAAELAGDDESLQATVLATMGLSRLLQGHPAEAAECLQEAYRFHAAEGADGDAGRDLLNLAVAHRQQGQLRREARCLRRAARHFQRAGAVQSLVAVAARRRQVDHLLALQQLDPCTN